MRTNVKVRSTQQTGDLPLVTTTETPVVTVSGVSTQSVDGIIRLLATAIVTGGTNTTFVTLRIRRGNGITGTVVGEGDPITLTGAAITVGVAFAEDMQGEVSNAQYTLTVQLTAATANGQVSFCSIQAMS